MTHSHVIFLEGEGFSKNVTQDSKSLQNDCSGSLFWDVGQCYESEWRPPSSVGISKIVSATGVNSSCCHNQHDQGNCIHQHIKKGFNSQGQVYIYRLIIHTHTHTRACTHTCTRTQTDTLLIYLFTLRNAIVTQIKSLMLQYFVDDRYTWEAKLQSRGCLATMKVEQRVFDG